MSSRSNTPVQDQRGDRYQADTGQSGGNAGFEEDPLVELARIVSEGNARYRPVALGTEGEAPAARGSYDASRDLIDHEAWARELEAVGFLQLTLAVQEKVGWNAGVALVA